MLIPFAAYRIAEHVGCSGILAAVSAGMVMNIQSLREGIPTVVRIRMTSTWTMIEFVFNGMVFILLGLQFPHIIGRALIEAHRDGNQQVWPADRLCDGRHGGAVCAAIRVGVAAALVRSRSAAKQGMEAPRPAPARSR